MRLILCVLHVLTGALLLAVPNMTRRELLFAVPVPPDFRDSALGRHALATFRIVVAAAVLAGVCAILLLPTRLINVFVPAVVLDPVLAGGIGFYWQYRRLIPFAVQPARPREAELTTVPDRMPWFAWFGAGPFAFIGAAAVYLYLNWDRIPARFPVHFGSDGTPNRWVERTTKGVYGFLFFAAELSAWCLAMALAVWFGSRRSRSRVVMLGFTIAMGYFLASLFTLIPLQPLLGIPVWVIAVSPIPFLIVMIIIMVNKMSEPSEPLDPTPQECWKGGVIYYNPDDAALFVEKRDGLGYTFNFANRWSWVLMASLAAVAASAFFVMA